MHTLAGDLVMPRTSGGRVNLRAIQTILATVLLLSPAAVAHARPAAGAPDTAAQGTPQPTDTERFDRAMAVFRSARQPESIPMFTQLIDDLQRRRARTDDETRLLAQCLLHRAQARLNLGQGAAAEADLRLMREIAPGFQTSGSGSDVATRSGPPAPAPMPAVGYVRLTITPEDAIVAVNGSAMNPRLGPVSVPSGMTTVSVTRDGYVSETRQVDVAVGQTVPVQIALRRTPAAAPPAPMIAAPRPAAPAPQRGASSGRFRGFVSVDFGIMMPAEKTFTQAIEVEAREEIQRESHVYRVDTGTVFGGGGGIWLTRNFGIGVAVDRFSNENPANVTLSIPHFFFFNSDIERSIDTRPLKRTETGIHINALFAVPMGDRVQITLFGGLSRISISQEMVADYEILETIVGFPEFTDDFEILPETFTFDNEKASGVGFNAGADLTFFVTRNVGVGGTVRFARATVAIRDKLEEFYNDTNVTRDLTVGGVRVSGGIRIRF